MTNSIEARESYTVVWQSSGRNGTWRCIFDQGSKEWAIQKALGIVRMGYPAYVRERSALAVIGLPEGPAPAWDYEALRWKNA